jgi:hypothetical protein
MRLHWYDIQPAIYESLSILLIDGIFLDRYVTKARRAMEAFQILELKICILLDAV